MHTTTVNDQVGSLILPNLASCKKIERKKADEMRRAMFQMFQLD